MKKGDLVRLKGEPDSWTVWVARRHGYLFIISGRGANSSYMRCKSLATGGAVSLHERDLEQANEEG